MVYFQFLFCTFVCLIATWTDVHTRTIPDWLTKPAIVLSLLFNILVAFWSGNYWLLLLTFISFGTAVLLGYMLFLAKVIAGGDVKLLWVVIVSFAPFCAFGVPLGLVYTLFLFIVGGAYCMFCYIVLRQKDVAYAPAFVLALLACLPFV